MSSNEMSSVLDAISLVVRATNTLTKDFDQSNESNEKLTTEMLVDAIKVTSIPIDYQEKLTPTIVNTAIKLTKKSSNREEQHENLTTESLIIALKLAIKALQPSFSDNNTEDISTNEMLTTMKASIAMSGDNQSNEPITPEILANAIKLANK